MKEITIELRTFIKVEVPDTAKSEEIARRIKLVVDLGDQNVTKVQQDPTYTTVLDILRGL